MGILHAVVFALFSSSFFASLRFFYVFIFEGKLLEFFFAKS